METIIRRCKHGTDITYVGFCFECYKEKQKEERVEIPFPDLKLPKLKYDNSERGICKHGNEVTYIPSCIGLGPLIIGCAECGEEQRKKNELAQKGIYIAKKYSPGYMP